MTVTEMMASILERIKRDGRASSDWLDDAMKYPEGSEVRQIVDAVMLSDPSLMTATNVGEPAILSRLVKVLVGRLDTMSDYRDMLVSLINGYLSGKSVDAQFREVINYRIPEGESDVTVSPYTKALKVAELVAGLDFCEGYEFDNSEPNLYTLWAALSIAREATGVNNQTVNSDGEDGPAEKKPPTELQQFRAMLNRVHGIGHGTHGNVVQVEADFTSRGESDGWTVTSFTFDADGKLESVACARGEKG